VTSTTADQPLPVAASPALSTKPPKTFLTVTLERIRADAMTMGPVLFILLIGLLALLANPLGDWLVGVDPNRTNLDAALQPPLLPSMARRLVATAAMPIMRTEGIPLLPSLARRLADFDHGVADSLLEVSGDVTHWMGTDSLGRDQLVRLLHGARVSMLIAFCAAGIAFALGITIGMLAGFLGGKVDDFILWLINTFSSLPTLFVLILLTSIYKPNAILLTLFLGFFGWIGPARFTRGQVLQIKTLDYATAARALGASRLRIMWYHIMPNTIPLIIVLIMVDIGSLVLAESVLSFLGFGVQPPQATWGSMLANSENFYFLHDPTTGNRVAWHLIFPPGILIFLTVLALYLLGDGLRDAIDPQLRVDRQR
jgi:peptide/nickel transport system permease protein